MLKWLRACSLATMPEHTHQRLACEILGLSLEIITHYLLYLLFSVLVFMRACIEELCWRIDMSAIYVLNHESPADEYWSMPWYLRILERPTKTTWHYVNSLMLVVEAIHAYACHPEYFALPSVTYYNLGSDSNYN